MRAKTLGIFLLIGFALFTAVYWITDTTRRDVAFATQERIRYTVLAGGIIAIHSGVRG